MRKKLFFWLTLVLIVILLIFAFANILGFQQYYILFYQVNTSATVAILFAGIIGFLIGFFAMLYSHELQKEKKMAEDEEALGAAPATTIEEEPSQAPEKTEQKPSSPDAGSEDSGDEVGMDDFDDDDEVLG